MLQCSDLSNLASKHIDINLVFNPHRKDYFNYCLILAGNDLFGIVLVSQNRTR